MNNIEQGLETTVRWYLEKQGWCTAVRERGGYTGGRLGLVG